MNCYDIIKKDLINRPKKWLITGVSGFIGSNLLEALLKLDQQVVGLDNFSTGHRRNLEEVHSAVTTAQWNKFEFHHGDIRNFSDCQLACQGVDYILHQAALGSVPRSIDDPIATNQSNIDGFLHMLVAARDANVKRFVYAASSSTYGDVADLPKVEDRIGTPLSPYAITKLVNELYAGIFSKTYGCETIGLRYFNIFGRRQDPNGAYAAVIPKWISSMLEGKPIFINGDGETSRDFCYIENAVQANILAATSASSDAVNQVYNVAVGARTTLNQLYSLIKDKLTSFIPSLAVGDPIYREFRAGDVRHSLASTEKSRVLLGYEPSHRIESGLAEAMHWYIAHHARLADHI